MSLGLTGNIDLSSDDSNRGGEHHQSRPPWRFDGRARAEAATGPTGSREMGFLQKGFRAPLKGFRVDVRQVPELVRFQSWSGSRVGMIVRTIWLFP